MKNEGVERFFNTENVPNVKSAKSAQCQKCAIKKERLKQTIDFQTSSGGGVSCFRIYGVHKLENRRQEEAKKPFKNDINVEIEPPNKHLKFNLFQKRKRILKLLRITRKKMLMKRI